MIVTVGIWLLSLYALFVVGYMLYVCATNQRDLENLFKED